MRTSSLQNVILFNRKFDDSAVSYIFDKFQALEEAGEQEVTLLINSPGGHMHALKTILDIIYSTNLHVITVASGMAASCGFALTMAGDTRLAFKNTSFLSHQFSASSGGKLHELVADRKAQEDMNKFFIDHYMLHTGLDREKILQDLLNPSDVWLTATEALKLGIIDGIIEPKGKPIGIKARAKANDQDVKARIRAAKQLLAVVEAAEA